LRSNQGRGAGGGLSSPLHNTGAGQVVGILLAAGKGSRFDPTGVKNKLVQPLANGDRVVSAAAKKLLAEVPAVLAVVRPGADAVASELRALGCKVTACPTADDGMGASLVHALSRASDAAGWVIALGDMPHVQATTIAALVAAIRGGVDIATPVYQGRRGNPVAFSRAHLQRLLQLTGDQGARNLLREFPVCEIAVDDAGILYDVDSQQDLSRLP
jgi:molybdenum cofactor cytidylyltransferase